VSPPVGPFTKMPAPALPDSADGYDAFDDSVRQANTNLGVIPPWAATRQIALSTGQTFTSTAVSVTNPAIWRLDSFNAFKLNHLIQMDCQMTLLGSAIASTATGSLTSPLLTMVNTALRPLTVWTPTFEARLNDTGVMVILGWATLDAIQIWQAAIPSRSFGTGAVLRFHATYLDQWVDTTLMP
jgi:hypothetical protein